MLQKKSRKPPSNRDKTWLFLVAWDRLSSLRHEVTPSREYKWEDAPRGPGKRRRRIDWAFPEHKVGVEVDGNAWHVRGGGGHSQDRDREKGNDLTMAGWKILRFSPKMLEVDPAGCVKMVLVLLASGGNRARQETACDKGGH